MKISIKLLLILYFLLTITNLEVGAKNPLGLMEFSDYETVLDAGKKLYSIISKMFQDPPDLDAIWSEVSSLLEEDEDEVAEVKEKLTDISSQLNFMLERMDAKFSTIERLINQLPMTIDIDRIKGEIATIIKRIHFIYSEAVKYSANVNEYNNFELMNVASTLTGLQGGALKGDLARLHDYIVPSAATSLKEGFLNLLNEHDETHGDSHCGDVQSPNQYMFNLFKVIITTELMGQVAQTFGYSLQKKLNNVTIEFELAHANEQRQKRFQEYFKTFESAITRASVLLRPCDPPKLVKDVTYIEMERLYQKVLAKDYDKVRDSCRGGCEDVNYVNWKDDDNGNQCSQLYDCQYLGKSTYCLPRDGVKRYEWIKDAEGNTHGSNRNCQGSEVTISDTMYYFGKCEVCVCTCQEGSSDNSDAKIAVDMSWKRSDSSNNKVVTGIKVAKCKPSEIITIQIREGTLLSEGEIDQNSESWQECGDTEPADVDELQIISDNSNYINLDDVVEEKPNSVVTGVRFGSRHQNGITQIKLELEFRQFDYKTGKLGDWDGQRSSNNQHSVMANTLDADSPFVQKPGDENVPQPTGNTYVQFGPSSLKGDAGQTTIPLWDAQPVQSCPSAPLSGIGLFFKDSLGFGGFLGFRIYAINRGHYMNGPGKD